jgi:hypothetical protein
MAYHRSFYGIGSITAIPSGTNPTPVDIAVVRGCSVEFKSTEKPLRGNKLFALDSAVSDVSITGKIQSADFYASMVALVVPGTATVAATVTPRKKMATHSALIPATPFQVTVTNSAAWVTDLGVVNLTTGKTMTRVASTPAANQYTVAAGVYTFASAEGTVAIRYLYTDATTGYTLTATNTEVGAASGYTLILADPAGGTKENVIEFPSVKFSNLSLGMKTDDWSESGLDFTAYADANGIPFYTYGNE